MGIRESVATFAINLARRFGRALGCELVVELSDHSIETSMEHPDKEKRAWDSHLYKKGQVFIKGYANPIKPSAQYNKELENPDTVDAKTSVVADGGEEIEDQTHVELISSPRYREYMRQDLISQVLNPREQWRLIFFAVLGVLGFLLINIALSASAAGIL